MGAEDLIERGFHSLAFVGEAGAWHTEDRLKGFSQRAQEAGVEAKHWTGGSLGKPPYGPELSHWLAQLPRPLGILASNDHAAGLVIRCCREANIAVPEHAAVLGVDNDELAVLMIKPSLSSIALPSEAMGFEAAAMIDRLLKGESLAHPLVLFPPTRVVTRQSTDLMAIADAEVAEAVRFIRQQAAKEISVADVARHVAVSRRALEQRFRTALGRSPLDEILRIRLERARQLLQETSLSIEQIANACSFSSASYLGVVFRRLTGMTPSECRKRAGGSP